MPNRTLKETITTSERLAALSFEAEALFYRLLVCADDFGRFDARPVIVRSRAMPLRDVCLSDVGQWTDELRAHDLIAVYEVNGKPYLQIQRWEQRKRANKSKYPDSSGSYSMETDTCAKNDGQLTDIRPTSDGRLSPEERGARSEERGKSSTSAGDACPHQSIVDLYHELLPANPRVKTWTGSRQANLRTRWREDAKRQSLDYWRRLFAHVAASPFLTGQTVGQSGRPFHAALDWIVKPDNFAKIIEGRYHDRSAA